ncbi:ATP-binding protein [Paraburkholderia lacunae]|uniref:ATP-binding protein n=1 Tax=Paraburkholderia lacunae TaxID=2211104 RepID=UPI00313441C0
MVEHAGLRLTVRDNGVGFRSFDETSHLGTGMSSMRTRAQRLGGTLDLQSAPGATVVTLWMPENRDADATISSADTTAF